jgi:hypothetical protein
MIKLHGPEKSPEYEYGLELETSIIESWPSVPKSNGQKIDIIVNAQCHVGENREVDLFVLGKLNPAIPLIDPQKPDQKINILNFAFAIEVKNHTDDSVMFKGTEVYVLYNKKWKHVSSQSDNQIYSLRDYLQLKGIRPPFINNLIWLRNLPKSSLPKGPHNIFGADSKWHEIMSAFIIMRTNRISKLRDGQLALYDASKSVEKDFTKIIDVFTKEILPSKLDRPKLEEINKQILTDQLYSQRIGQQILIFRGRGGTGKTVRLLRIAKNLYDDFGARVLILTYNLALVSDIRRLLAIMRIGFDITDKSIHITNIHKFFRRAFKCFGILDVTETDYIAKYDDFKKQTLNQLKEFSRTELIVLADDKSYVFDWDYILVDEAQDWPTDEKEILYMLFDYRKFILADGEDQLVRGYHRVDWRKGVDSDKCQIVPLKKCLRLKRALCLFIRSFARHIGLGEYPLEPNVKIHGGRVIIVVGGFKGRDELLIDIMRENEKAGNEPIDMLFCVPPKLVDKNKQRCAVAEYLDKKGLNYWDGTAKDIRGETYPTDLDQIRIVQYESCRGLEGWTVVNFKFDELYEIKKWAWSKEGKGQKEMFITDEEAAHLFAARWCMIPLTRAMDTIVIQVDSLNTKIGNVLKACYEDCKDFVTIWD